MAVPQPGIFAQGTRSHYHLEFDLRPGRHRRRDRRRGARVCASRRSPPAGPTSSSASAPTLWRRLRPTTRPPTLAPFEADRGRRPDAPATQHDIWVWIHGTGEDVELDIARGDRRRARAGGRRWRSSSRASSTTTAATSPASSTAPRTRRSRRRTTSRSSPTASRGRAARYVIAQKWVHDLDAFHAQDVEEQEGTIGRTKPDSVELDDKPDHRAHRPRRDRGGRRGARDLPPQRAVRAGRGARPLLPRVQRRPVSRFNKMLRRMFGTSGDGLHDHLTDFTTPVSGSFYFAPSLDALDGILPTD